MAKSFDITSATIDGIGPHGTQVGLLRVLGPAHVWALGVGIVLVGEYMGWNFAVGKGGAYAALLAAWMIWDFIRTDQTHSEALLTSSREGEIEAQTEHHKQ